MSDEVRTGQFIILNSEIENNAAQIIENFYLLEFLPLHIEQDEMKLSFLYGGVSPHFDMTPLGEKPAFYDLNKLVSKVLNTGEDEKNAKS